MVNTSARIEVSKTLIAAKLPSGRNNKGNKIKRKQI
ncbi:hypothetical protein BMETH_2248_0 [methanotrophic bacterial endosymbiont of Bathymodiolus sp.]|nr:hypothetical protein BMETH_2248_0 [methanotrophic bacterial endosymbiont of Bathymodiolus sp.]